MTAYVVELILTDNVTGTGTQENPFRRQTELYTKDGRLVARSDPLDARESIVTDALATLRSEIDACAQALAR